MKKTKLFLAIFLPVLTLATSCKDYLEEELVSTLTNDYYDTEQGVEDLVKAAYEPTRTKFNYEQAYALFNFGTDEFTNADQINHNYYNTYDARLNPFNNIDFFLNDVWNGNYDGINRCNIGIDRIPVVKGVKALLTNAQKNQRIAELRFLRGIYYFQLVQQFGSIPLVLTPSVGVRLEFPKSPIADVYKVILADLRFAADNLAPTAGSELGRATKGAAQHFLAKAYLTRGSAVVDQRGQQPTDMDSAAYYADEVIQRGPYALEQDYAKLWDISSYANSVVAQKSKEIIFSAQYNNNPLLQGRFGNQTHMYFLMSYDVNEPGMARDLPNGRPFRRLMPTNYAMDIYDRKHDSRFYKSMKTTYLSNTAGSIPKWTTNDAPSPDLVGKAKYAVGDTAILVVVNTPKTALKEEQIKKTRYRIYARYYTTAAGTLASHYSPTGEISQRGKFPSLIKYIDPFRANANEQKGTKDGILARLGETYLIAAEAYGRKGEYGKALEYINALRARAAYKAGEAKPPQNWLVEGGKVGDVSSTYDSLQVTETIFTENAATEMYPPSAAGSAEKRFIHFILNERARELLGELHRWEDLVRTETLEERAAYFNPDAQAIKPFHKLRPIPQQHIESIFINGAPLTPAQRQAEQNPGY